MLHGDSLQGVKQLKIFGPRKDTNEDRLLTEVTVVKSLGLGVNYASVQILALPLLK